MQYTFVMIFIGWCKRNPPQENEATFQEELCKDLFQNGGIDFGYSLLLFNVHGYFKHRDAEKQEHYGN